MALVVFEKVEGANMARLLSDSLLVDRPVSVICEKPKKAGDTEAVKEDAGSFKQGGSFFGALRSACSRSSKCAPSGRPGSLLRRAAVGRAQPRRGRWRTRPRPRRQCWTSSTPSPRACGPLFTASMTSAACATRLGNQHLLHPCLGGNPPEVVDSLRGFAQPRACVGLRRARGRWGAFHRKRPRRRRS
jgi:hypothetical protein